MTECLRAGFHRADKVCVLYHGEKRRLGIGPITALSIHTDCDPLEIMNDLSSTLVKFNRAMPPFVRVLWWANRIAGFGLIRRTTSCASRKAVFESEVLSSSRNWTWLSLTLTVVGRRERKTAARYKGHYVIARKAGLPCSVFSCSIER